MITTLLIFTSIGLIWAVVVAILIRSWGFFFRGIVFSMLIGVLAGMIGFFVAKAQFEQSNTGYEIIIILAVGSMFAYLGITASLAINLFYPVLNSKGRIEMKRTMPHLFQISRVLGVVLTGCFATVVILWIFDRSIYIR